MPEFIQGLKAYHEFDDEGNYISHSLIPTEDTSIEVAAKSKHHNTKIHKQKQYKSDEEQETNPFLIPLLDAGIPAYLAKMFLFAIQNEEDVFDIVDQNQKNLILRNLKKTEGPNGPVPHDKPKPKPKDDPKPKPDPKLDDFPTDDDEPYPQPKYEIDNTPIIFTTMQDSRVDDKICMPMHGDVYGISDADRPQIPLHTHPHCRCFYVHGETGEKLGQF